MSEEDKEKPKQIETKEENVLSDRIKKLFKTKIKFKRFFASIFSVFDFEYPKKERKEELEEIEEQEKLEYDKIDLSDEEKKQENEIRNLTNEIFDKKIKEEKNVRN